MYPVANDEAGPREVKWLAQGHIAGKWRRRDLNPGSQTPESACVMSDVEKKKISGTALLFGGTHVCLGQNRVRLETASLEVTLKLPLIPSKL